MKKVKTDEIVKFDENWDLENLKQTYNRMQKFGFVCEECGKEFFRILLHIKPNEKRLCHSCGNPNRKFKNIVTKETIFVDVTKEDPTKLYSKVQQISFNCLNCGKLTQRPNYSKDFLCKDCLSKKTKVEKYGSLEVAGEIKKQHMKETFKEKYGVENFSQTNEFKQKLKEKVNKRTPEERAAIKEKTIKTNREKYGKDYFCQTDEWLKVRGLDKEKIEKNKEFLKLSKEEKLEKRKERNKEKYGVDYYTQTEEFKKKAKLTKLQNGTWAKVTHKKYFFENLYFDSCQEVALYDFYKKQNKKIERNTTEYFEYIFKNEIHRYYPDFKLDNEYLEVKGDHLFELMQKEGTKDAAKYKCMQEHHVKILKSSEVNLLIGNMDFYKKFQINILNLPKPLKEKFNHLKYSCENFPFLNYPDEVLKRDWQVLCETKKEKPQAGKKLVKQFHKSIFECNKVGFLSPLKRFEKLENYEYSLKKVILKNSEKNEDEIKDEFLKNFRNFKVNTFQPGFAKYLIQNYLKDADVIFDPFSSFSSRMLAAVSCNKKYIGRDCSQKRIEESKQMSSFLQIEDKVDLKVKNVYEIEGVEKYQYMFTCIPYESERYEGTEESWIKSSDECIDFILQHFDCQKYVIVVDKTEKYKNHLIREVNNTSHFGKGFENILIFEKECN